MFPKTNVEPQVGKLADIQAARILERAKQEKDKATKEDKKGTDLDTKADRICKMAQHLQDTDSGEVSHSRSKEKCFTAVMTSTHTQVVCEVGTASDAPTRELLFPK